MTIPKDMHVGATFDTNNCGKIVILEYNHAKDVKVKFLDTNNTKTTRVELIRSGMVKDPFAKSVYGVGFYGDGKHSFKERKSTICGQG